MGNDREVRRLYIYGRNSIFGVGFTPPEVGRRPLLQRLAGNKTLISVIYKRPREDEL